MSKNKKSSVLNTNMTNHYLTEKYQIIFLHSPIEMQT